MKIYSLIIILVIMQGCGSPEKKEETNHLDNGIDLMSSDLNSALNEFNKVTKEDGDFEFTQSKKYIVAIKNALKFQKELKVDWDFKANWFVLQSEGFHSPGPNQHIFRFVDTDTAKYYGCIKKIVASKEGYACFLVLGEDGEYSLIRLIDFDAANFYQNEGDPSFGNLEMPQ